MHRVDIDGSGIGGLQPEDLIKLLIRLCGAGRLLLVSKLENYAVFRIDTLRLRGI
ncbi:hypothetical protein SAMN05216191_102120 [Paenibacillus jilunlii]|uniref:Uncharacterized protein n=1 Tax=Paenibacillus jilunlii TaxID=682956 RepID=A0A1G9IMQ7_9BACL|nr:hypothetical protein SAMN05216191_102120 [Paenibacillus jilunlii]